MLTRYAVECFNPATGQWVRFNRVFTTATEAIVYGVLVFPQLASRWAAI